jgi:hypothetical protein
MRTAQAWSARIYYAFCHEDGSDYLLRNAISQPQSSRVCVRLCDYYGGYCVRFTYHDLLAKESMMELHFLQRYRAAFWTIPGFFSFDAALLFMACNQLIKASGVAGDVLEIGVHHGLSAIALAALRGPSRRLVVIDLFEHLQAQNVSASGAGSEEAFLVNIRNFYDDVGFLQTIVGASAAVRPNDLGQSFSFCHVDGGHSSAETYQDLHLCAQILLPGGLLAVDDYFNAAFPGVCEGAVRFMLDYPAALKPIAIGFNKVLFQKEPVPFKLNERFTAAFPGLPKSSATLWGAKVHYFTSGLAPYFDLTNSTPQALAYRTNPVVIADIAPLLNVFEAKAGTKVAIEVIVSNNSTEPFPFGDGVFGLSYHVLSAEGKMLRYNNGRSYFEEALAPGKKVPVSLTVAVPDSPGEYQLELDLVWENICWFKDDGNPTCTVMLVAS